MRVNSMDQPVVEDELFQVWSQTTATDLEVREAIGLLLQHLQLKIVRTNATKHGNVELELERKE